jgi:LmbE family N-acetylglucosaminyl deacetylase
MRTLVIAPHPDDEAIGCGGTLLRRGQEGGELAWLIVTGMSEAHGWAREHIATRDDEINRVAERFGFASVVNLRLPAARLETLPMSDIVRDIGAVVSEFEPEEVLLPHRGDAHTDHRIVFDAAAACTKWFRYPSVRQVLGYETLSETDFGLDPESQFRPTVFVDIEDQLEQKLEVMALYRSEIGEFPFPRSVEAVRSLARLRGAASGFAAAEAFELLRMRQ